MAVRFNTTNKLTFTLNNFPTHTGIGSSFTFLWWAKRKVDTNNFAAIMYSTNRSGFEVFVETATDGDTLNVYELPTETFTTGPTLANDVWNFGAYKRSNTAQKQYWGTEAGGALSTNSLATSRTPTNNMIDVYIGDDAYTEGLNGEISYVRIWTVELTDAEIDAEYYSAVPVKTANLWADYRLPNAAGALTDSSGNGRTLTLTGTVTDGGADPTIPSASLYLPRLSLLGVG